MGENVDIELNDIYHDLLDIRKDYDVIANIGSAQSGKTTHELAVQNIIECIEDRRRVIVARKVAKRLEDGVIEEVLTGLERFGYEEEVDYSYHKTERKITLFDSESEILFRGIESDKDIKGFAGANKIILEEANEFTYRDFLQCTMRMRDKRYKGKKQLILMSNPDDDIQNWINQVFNSDKAETVFQYFNAESPDALRDTPQVYDIKEIITDDKGEEVELKILVIRTTYRDNAFVSPAEKAFIESMKDKDEEYYRMYGLGLAPIKKEYLLRNRVKVVSYDQVLKIANKTMIEDWNYGLDFGVDPDPTAIPKFTTFEVEGEKNLYIHDEIYGTNLRLDDIVMDLKKWKNPQIIGESADKFTRNEMIYKYTGVHPSVLEDPNESETKKRDAKRKIDAFFIPVSKYEGITDDIVTMFKQFDNIYINERCEGAYNDLYNFKRKVTKGGVITTQYDRTYKHTVDAIGYHLITIPQEEKKPKQVTVWDI